MQWSDFLLNRIFTSVAVLLFIISLRRIIGIFPLLLGGVFRCKKFLELEDSFRQARDRDIAALSAFFTFCVIVSKCRMYCPDFVIARPEAVRTLITFAVLAGATLLRALLGALLYSKKLSKEGFSTASKAVRNVLTVAVALMALSLGVLSALKFKDLDIRNILFCELGFFYLLAIIRRQQIMSNVCGGFQSFLYLCALEFIPVGLLAASAVCL